MTTRQLEHRLGQWRLRGRVLARQGQTVARLLADAPVDLRAILGPTLLLGQAYAKGMHTAIAAVMSDPDFLGVPLDLQGSVGLEATRWTALHATLGAFAFAERLPTLAAITATTAPAALLGANARGVALASRLEALLSPETRAGLSVDTFWTLTQSGRAALGRLAALDPVVEPEPDIDVLAETGVVLDQVAPLALDAVTLIQRVEAVRVPTYREVHTSQLRTALVPEGVTLPELARQLLGDSEAWRLLVEFNRLRYPYLSADPLDQLGVPQGPPRALAHAVAAGDAVLQLVDAHGLYPDQRMRLDSGGAAELVTVEIVDVATGMVTVTPPVAVAYPVTALMTVYPPAYEVIGRVLVPGDTILVPLRDPAAAGPQVGPSRRNTLPLERLYGTDLSVTAQGHLQVTDDGDFVTVTGLPNLIQALRHRLHVPRGSLPHYPTYGSGLEAFLGLRDTPFFTFLASVEARATVLRDPRIRQVEALVARVTRDRLELELRAVTSAADQFPATRLDVPLRAA